MNREVLERAIAESGSIVCLLGMNVSVDCGCFNYRDSDCAYSVESRYGYSPEEIFSANFFGTRTKIFFDYLRSEILSHLGEPAEPFPTLKRMEEDGKIRAFITRSIYGLPLRAGLRNCIMTHGTVLRGKCTHCGERYDVGYMKKGTGIPLCGKCGAVVRPDIVLDGEMIPNSLITASAYEVERADTLLVLGCSMRSTLVKNVVKYFEGRRIILIKEEENYSDAIADFVFYGKPGDILPKIYR